MSITTQKSERSRKVFSLTLNKNLFELRRLASMKSSFFGLFKNHSRKTRLKPAEIEKEEGKADKKLQLLRKSINYLLRFSLPNRMSMSPESKLSSLRQIRAALKRPKVKLRDQKIVKKELFLIVAHASGIKSNTVCGVHQKPINSTNKHFIFPLTLSL